MNKVYEVKLTYEELLLLDGKCRESAQEVINTAKQEQIVGFDLPVLNEVILKSMKIGTLSWRHKGINRCPYCDKGYDYHVYPRTTKFHRKGEKNYSKPVYYSGIAFNEGGVTVQGLGAMCSECAEKHNVYDKLVAYVLDNDLPIQLMNRKEETRYKKDPIRTCFECKEEIPESKMGMLPAVMGGEYPGECPHCHAKSLLFGRSHGITNKFVMIKVKE